MLLNWFRSSRAEDRLETWIARRHQERVLAGETTSTGPHPGEAFLRDLARKSKRLSLSDPRIDHAASCSICMSQLLSLRHEYSSRQKRLVFATAVSACALVIVGSFITYHALQKSSTTAETAVVSQTVNLWDAGTVRGEQPGALQSVSLPATPVRLRIILPRFSPAGRYVVAVTRDRSGSEVLAQAAVDAVATDQQESLLVNLDLHSAVAGAYFLATTHEQDQAAYYYPLQIK